MKTGPKALYILEARDRQDVGFNITGKLSEKIRRGKRGQRAKLVCRVLSASSDTNYAAASVWKATPDNASPSVELSMPITQTSQNNPRGTYSVDNKDRQVSIIYLPGLQRQNNAERTYNAVFFFKTRFLNKMLLFMIYLQRAFLLILKKPASLQSCNFNFISRNLM